MTSATPRISASEIARLIGQHAPTDEQVAVIEAPLEPALVVAGAGSGKTETMAARVVWLIANDLVEPDRVLGLTFTRKAAGELQARVANRLAQLARAQRQEHSWRGDLFEQPTVATYNSYAASLVADHGLRLGIEPESRLLTEANQWQLASQVVESWDGDLDPGAAISTVTRAVLAMSSELGEHLVDVSEARRTLDAMLERISALPFGPKRRSRGADVDILLRSLATRRSLLDLVEAYRQAKRAVDGIDYGDQIAFAAQLARTVPQVGEVERARFGVVLLDEYQDTSYAQAELLAGLFGGGHPVTAVGDPHQSIYGWRGASAAGIGRFPGRFVTRAATAAPVYPLSTSWRNDTAILDAANSAAAPLRDAGALAVPPLALRPGAGAGVVNAQVAETMEAEAEAVADWISARWRPSTSAEGRATAAVLCRKRSQFAAVDEALRGRGIPVEVVGLGGLLATPEVVDIIALLESAHDPSRGDAVMRLLTGPRVNLGAGDLYALGSWAADLVRPDDEARRSSRSRSSGLRSAHAEQPEAEPVESDSVDLRSLIDALDDLPRPGVAARDGRVLTSEGRDRLVRLGRMLRELRAATYLSLPELVVQAERALGLDVEVAVARTLADVLPGAAERVSTRGRAHLDAFRDVAAAFTQSAETATLGAFLAWLDVAKDEENGLDLPVREPDPDAVQIITIHAAKGLEWDAVAVPGLVDGLFPTQAQPRNGPRTAGGWLSDLGALPYPLRGDAADLPGLDWFTAADCADLATRCAQFRVSEGARDLAEERRLAYVAVTRARHDLLLTAHWWGTSTKPRRLSPFLQELAAAGLLVVDRRDEEPEPDSVNPRTLHVVSATWPMPDGDGEAGGSRVRDVLREAAERVTAARETAALETAALETAARDPEAGTTPASPLARLAAVLLAERAARAPAEVAMPAHVSASGLVRLAADRDDFALQLRRPIPQEPTILAGRGTRFHEWAQQYFTASSLVDIDDLTGADDDEVADTDLGTLRDRFLASPWAGRAPIAVEQDIEVPLAGLMIRCRIDAVFADPDVDPAIGGPNSVVVIDWKTGRPPHDEAARAAREVQLAVYRLAWSRWTGLPIEQVNAAFHYVASGQTVRPAQLLDEHQLVALVTAQ